MAEPWYKAAFGEHYTQLYAHRNEDEARDHLPRIEDLARLHDNEGAILDCGCGTGRYTRLFRERGHRVFGLDFSSDLLAMAAKDDGGVGGWVRGDMLNLPFEGSFSRVLSLFTSFGYFEKDSDNLRALSGMIRSLNQGGLLYLDFLNESTVRASDWEEKEMGGLGMRSKKSITPKREAVVKEVEIYRGEELVTCYSERVKLYGLEWFESSLKVCGAELLDFYGSEKGGAYGEDSPRLIVLAKRLKV